MMLRRSLGPLAPLGAPLATLAACAVAVAVAYREGGAADAEVPPPRAEAGVPRDSGTRASGGDLSVKLRFVEALGTAKIDAPRAAELRGILSAHWRKLRPPFVSLPPDAGRLVSSFSLRTSELEEQHSVATHASGGSAGAWKPDVRLWNMNEGSFDQRESLVLPVPSELSYAVDVPEGARVVFGAGTANFARTTTVFRVRFAGQGQPPVEACAIRVPPAKSRRWSEASCDLSALAGRRGEVRLSVSAEAPAEDELAPRKPAPRAGDGGVHEDSLMDNPGLPAVALLGNPLLLGRGSSVPYNVLWVVIDALRPDVIASFHDPARDEKIRGAELDPLDALLPGIPGLMPGMDGLAARGVRFESAYSAASWTRPGTLAMLSGARSTELGIETKKWILDGNDLARFYGSDPPLLPLVLRRAGMSTRAFVNNYFLVGYTGIGMDMGFERVFDHRYRTRDTKEITDSAEAYMREHKDERFFAFVNFNSPHEPYDPPEAMLARLPPEAPKDPTVRRYMAEAAKDDAALLHLLAVLDELALRERTLVVVTSDHGETLSLAHQGKSPDGIPIRFHHSASNFEETTRIPILLSLPGVLPEDVAIKARVRSTDIAPSVLDVLGLSRHPRMSGRSLIPLARGGTEPDERVVVTEGRATRSLLHGRWHYLVYDAQPGLDGGAGSAGSERLFDLEVDPGERRDMAHSLPDMLAEMRARLAAALQNVQAAGTAPVAEPRDEKPPQVHLRFAGGRSPRRVSGRVRLPEKARIVELLPFALPPEAVKEARPGDKGEQAFDLSFTTAPDGVVGFDLVTDPPGADLSWEIYFDDVRLSDSAFFAGPFGLATRGLAPGLAGEALREAVRAARPPEIDPLRDLGVFVTRDRKGGALDERDGDPGEGAAEMARMLREWGYAHGSGGGKK